jgi:hypothetical protein
VTSLEVDGKPVEGNIVPLPDQPGSDVEVIARISGG